MRTERSGFGFARTYLLPATWLFALPLVALWFSGYATTRQDAEILASIEGNLAQAPDLSSEARARAEAFFRATPASRACLSEQPALASYRADLGEACSSFEQFRWIEWLALGSLALALCSTLLAALSALASFASRELQYLSLAIGWNVLKVAGALQASLQGTAAVFLSFWMTALFTQRYFPKLILLVGVAAAMAVYAIIRAIFQRLPSGIDVEGELLDEGRAPQLWARLRTLAAELGTAPPDHVVAGIDDNFFVSEGEVRVGEHALTGRTLYLSLSLLRFLERSEADAVLAHELAHLLGGDTGHGKKLAPLLSRFSSYLNVLYDGVVTRPIAYFMGAYYSLFALSLGRSQRRAELAADILAARLTSAADIARSLVKINAYSHYRGRVESALFAQNERQTELSVAARVARGFADYARTEALHFDLHESTTPHPFDSHPPLRERLRNVGSPLEKQELERLLLLRVELSWVDTIVDAPAIEQRLWSAYESRFAAAHELMLAYRFEPSDAEQQAHVEKHFPQLSFASKDGRTEVHIDYAKITCSEWEGSLSFDDIESAQVVEVMFKKQLKLKKRGSGVLTPKLTIPLGKLAEPELMMAAYERYYGRHLAMRDYQRSELPASDDAR